MPEPISGVHKTVNDSSGPIALDTPHTMPGATQMNFLRFYKWNVLKTYGSEFRSEKLLEKFCISEAKVVHFCCQQKISLLVIFVLWWHV